MTRSQPAGRPALGPIRDAATAALGRPITIVEPRPDGSYGLELGTGETATLRLAPDCSDAAGLVEPCLLSSLSDADIPTPELLAAVDPDTSPFGVAFCIVDADRGQQLDDVLDLPDHAHERLVREAGEQLAALHRSGVDVRESEDGGPYGDLRVPACHPDAPLVVIDASEDEPAPGHERWPDWLDVLTERTLDALDPEFADLAPTVREGIAAADVPERRAVAPLHLGYEPGNLEFEPGVTWPSHEKRDAGVVRTVRGFDAAVTGDGLLDLAAAEDALVGLPLGGTERGRELTATLREAYVGERGVPTPFGERYAAYLLFARARLLATVEEPHRRSREHDAFEAGIRFRERVQSLAESLK